MPCSSLPGAEVRRSRLRLSKNRPVWKCSVKLSKAEYRCSIHTCLLNISKKHIECDIKPPNTRITSVRITDTSRLLYNVESTWWNTVDCISAIFAAPRGRLGSLISTPEQFLRWTMFTVLIAAVTLRCLFEYFLPLYSMLVHKLDTTVCQTCSHIQWMVVNH